MTRRIGLTLIALCALARAAAAQNTPVILIEQTGAPAGTPGASRKDLTLPGNAWRFTDTNNTPFGSGGPAILWELIWSPPSSTATFGATSTSDTGQLTGHTAGEWGSWRVKCTRGTGPTAKSSTAIVRLVSPNHALNALARGETTEFNSTYAYDYHTDIATIDAELGTCTLQDEGSPVTGTPHSTLNFVGAGVSVADGGGGVATVTIGGAAGNTLDGAYDEGAGAGAGRAITADAGAVRIIVDAVSGYATAAIEAVNTTAASGGAPIQPSPSVLQQAAAWDTNPGVTTKIESFVYTSGVSADPAVGTWNVIFDIDDADTLTDALTVDSNGVVYVGRGVYGAIGAAVWPLVKLVNDTAATAGIPVQSAPALEWTYEIWDTGEVASDTGRVSWVAGGESGDPSYGRVSVLFDHDGAGYDVSDSPMSIRSDGDVYLGALASYAADADAAPRLYLNSEAAATVGTQLELSPGIVQVASAWDTDGSVARQILAQVVAGGIPGTVVRGTWNVVFNMFGGGYDITDPAFAVDSDGNAYVGGGDGIGQTVTPRLHVANETAATAGTQQPSPALLFGYQVWDTGESANDQGFAYVLGAGVNDNPSSGFVGFYFDHDGDGVSLASPDVAVTSTGEVHTTGDVVLSASSNVAVYASTSGATMTVRGNEPAGDTGVDVIVQSTATRTAGAIFRARNNTDTILELQYDGDLVLGSASQQQADIQFVGSNVHVIDAVSTSGRLRFETSTSAGQSNDDFVFEASPGVNRTAGTVFKVVENSTDWLVVENDGDTTFGGDIDAAGGLTVSSWWNFSTPVGTGTNVGDLFGETTSVWAQGWRAPRAGSVIAVTVSTDNARTAGTLTLRIEKSTDHGDTWSTLWTSGAVIDATNTRGDQDTATKDTFTFAAGDHLRAVFVTSGFTPTSGTDVGAVVVVEL